MHHHLMIINKDFGGKHLAAGILVGQSNCLSNYLKGVMSKNFLGNSLSNSCLERMRVGGIAQNSSSKLYIEALFTTLFNDFSICFYSL